MLLAIDTSLGVSVAVVDRDRGILVEISESGRADRAAIIGKLIAQALTQSDTPPASLSGVAVGIGPGPAASVDIGIAAARGFAAALAKPVVRVLAHDAAMLGRSDPAIVVTDAGGGLRAWTAYGEPDPELGLPVRLSEPSFDSSADAADSDAGFGSPILAVDAISAGALGMLAERLFAAGRSFAREEPYYSPLPGGSLQP